MDVRAEAITNQSRAVDPAAVGAGGGRKECGLPRNPAQTTSRPTGSSLTHDAEAIFLRDPPSLLCLPWQDCSYFNSNAVPLKLSFQNVDPLGENIRVIFKVRTPLKPGGMKVVEGRGERGSKGVRSPRAVLISYRVLPFSHVEDYQVTKEID